MNDETENDWQDRTFMEKAVPVFRVHAGEYVCSAASQTKLLGLMAPYLRTGRPEARRPRQRPVRMKKT